MVKGCVCVCVLGYFSRGDVSGLVLKWLVYKILNYFYRGG